MSSTSAPTTGGDPGKGTQGSTGLVEVLVCPSNWSLGRTHGQWKCKSDVCPPLLPSVQTTHLRTLSVPESPPWPVSGTQQACLAPPHALDFSGTDTDAVHQTACCQLQTPAGNMEVSLRKLPHTPQVHLLHHLISRPSSNTGQLLRASPHPRVKVT